MSLKRTLLEAGRLWESGTACLTSCFKKVFLQLKYYMLMVVKIEV